MTMKWSSLLSKRRFGTIDLDMSTSDGRTQFESDVDRVVFSGTFRRLNHKTQVHPLTSNDHIHTRLTHSLEVSQVGRSLGKNLAMELEKELPSSIHPSDVGSIVQAACLAHDIGNPPFGHQGETVVRHWFENNSEDMPGSLDMLKKQDLISFEGNAQGFRVLTQTENHLFHGGLRLTYATLGTFLKYPWSSRVRQDKFGAFLTEEHILEEVASELGMCKRGCHKWARHPLAYLVEAADDICYAITDLEDAVELGILSIKEVKELLLSPFTEREKVSIQTSLGPDKWHRVNLARIRGYVFDRVVSGAVRAFMQGYDDIMNGEFEGNVFDLLDETDSTRELIVQAKELAREKVYSSPRKVELELGAYSTYDHLLTAFCRAAVARTKHLEENEAYSLDKKSGLVLRLLGEHAPGPSNKPPKSEWTEYQCLRRVLDFISGMTDNYAVYVAQQLQGLASGWVPRL